MDSRVPLSERLGRKAIQSHSGRDPQSEVQVGLAVVVIVVPGQVDVI